MDERSQSLLQWSTAHSTPEGVEEARQRFDPERDRKWLDVLMKTDAQRMIDALSIYNDPNRPRDDKVEALTELEFLVESIDNANGTISL